MKKDKIIHAVVGAGASAWVSLPAYLSVTPSGDGLFSAIWTALWVAIIVGIIKEWCDQHTDGNRWDWMDFLATVIGGVVVVLLILGLHFGRG